MQEALPHSAEELSEPVDWSSTLLKYAAQLAAFTRNSKPGPYGIKPLSELVFEANSPEHLKQAAAKLLDLASGVLDLAALQSGEFAIANEDFNLRQLLNDAKVLGAGRANAQGLMLDCRISPDVPEWAKGDALRLQQAIVALVDHILDHTASGNLTLEVSHDPFRQNRLYFALESAAMVRAKPAESFQLKLCAALLAKMGSSLEIWHELEGGGSFTFRLTLETATIDDASATSMASSQYRLLVAEDSQDSRYLLQEFLRPEPYQLKFVENGQKAVEAAQNENFDLILMDIQMPVMDGLTATRIIREAEKAAGRKPVPLLALTGNTRRADIELSRAAGCSAHLLKPISRQELLMRITQFLPASTGKNKSQADLQIPPGLEEAARRYLRSRTDDLSSLRALLGSKDFSGLETMAHNMKGTGTSYGFPDLTRLGMEMENAAKQHNATELTGQLAELASYVQRAETALATR